MIFRIFPVFTVYLNHNMYSILFTCVTDHSVFPRDTSRNHSIALREHTQFFHWIPCTTACCRKWCTTHFLLFEKCLLKSTARSSFCVPVLTSYIFSRNWVRSGSGVPVRIGKYWETGQVALQCHEGSRFESMGRPFCAGFSCSPHVCVVSLQVLQLPPHQKTCMFMYIFVNSITVNFYQA